MKLTVNTLQFIRNHRKDDVRSLALQAQRHGNVDMPAALTQIAGWQAAAEKIPSWQQREGICYPPHLPLEQCSSEVTAQYKASILAREEEKPGALTDLTGGFGIDCAFLATRFQQVTYVERQAALCEIAGHNFPLLGLEKVRICQEDAIAHLQKMEPVDWIFIDPARRDGKGGKTVAIADCEPNVAELEMLLLEKAQQVMVKLSPMLDLSIALQELRHIQEVHILSINNECKELLLILGQGCISAANIPVHCINLPSKDGKPGQRFSFTRGEELSSPCEYTPTLGTYLYEPNASLLKAGAFRSTASLYQLKKLHPNSHLYTSDALLTNFPGRKFRIISHCTFSKHALKQEIGTEKKANLTVRNFPASVAELRKRLKLTEGGETYLFATTLADEQKVLVRCEKEM